MLYKDKNNILQYKFIRIIGGAGSGKTTLGRNLSQIIGYPLIELDKFRHRKQFINKALSQKKWIVEGVQYNKNYRETFENADLVICLDYPLKVRQWFVIKRYLAIKLKKTESTRKCNLKSLIQLLIWNRNFEKNRLHMYEIMYSISAGIVVFKSPKELRQWLNRQKG